MGVEVYLTFVDPDIVETATVFRQNFCFAEVGLNKAETLALRLSAGWGVEIHAQPAPFDRKMAFAHSADLVIVIGCVDNAAARTAIAATLDQRGAWEGVNWRYDPSAGPMRIWWLDLGNSKESGQALLGSTCQPARLKNAFPLPDRCGALPAPSLQHPELLDPRPEELSPEKSGLSCEEMAARNAQSLVINRTVADLGAAYLVQLLFELQRQALMSLRHVCRPALDEHAIKAYHCPRRWSLRRARRKARAARKPCNPFQLADRRRRSPVPLIARRANMQIGEKEKTATYPKRTVARPHAGRADPGRGLAGEGAEAAPIAAPAWPVPATVERPVNGGATSHARHPECAGPYRPARPLLERRPGRVSQPRLRRALGTLGAADRRLPARLPRHPRRPLPVRRLRRAVPVAGQAVLARRRAARCSWWRAAAKCASRPATCAASARSRAMCSPRWSTATRRS